MAEKMPSNQFLARAVRKDEAWKLQIRINKQTYISAKEYKTGALASSAAKRFMERMNETASH